MYIVTMKNGAAVTEIQNEHHKLFSGSVVKGINTIDSFTFSILPDNPAFGALRDFTTLVSVYNLARRRYEFQGRVLYTSPQMNDKGLITQEAICESYLGFLCDSQQEYVEEKNWTVRGFLEHILNVHNSQVEDYKHFTLGQVWEDADPKNNLYLGIQRENSWETLKKKLIETLGGEVRFREVDGVLHLDYVEQLGGMCSTEIALSKNMKSIVKEKNPSAFITRLIPLGAKEYDSNENSRYDITSVNGGKNYIDDAEAIAEYGLHVGYVEFDDVTEPANLLTKAQEWLRDNNKVSIKYAITALDLSLIGLDVDDFDVCNTYPLKNSLLGIDDTARINKKTIDVCDETKTSIEIGESFKTLSEIQREAVSSIGKLNTDVAEIIRNYATNQKLASEISKTVSLIEQTEQRITLGVSGTYASQEALEALESSISLTESSILSTVAETYATQASLNNYATKSSLEQTASSITASVSATYATQASVDTISGELSLKVDKSALVSELNASADIITIKGKRLTIDTDYFKLSETGTLEATAGNIAGLEIGGNALTAEGPVYLRAGTSAYIGLNTFSDGGTATFTVGIQAYCSNNKVYVRIRKMSGDTPLLLTEYEVRFKVRSYNLVGGITTWEETCRLRLQISTGVSFWYESTNTADFPNRYGSTFEANFTNLVGSYIDADRVDIANLEDASSTKPYLYEAGSYSSLTVTQQTSAQMEIHGSLIPTLAGSNLGAPSFAWNDVFATNYGGVSDRNLKNTITDLSESYSALFDRLRPVTFKFNDGTSGRLHTGFIAQEVGDALEAAGISTEDFAAYCAWEKEDGSHGYALRYTEFIPLCVSETQKLKDRVKQLEERMATL